MRFWKNTAIHILVILLFSAILTGCGAEKAESNADVLDHGQPQRVLVTMENGKTFIIETAPQYAPETVDNFLDLVESGFYDGLTFHRIIDGFMAQGGDPKGNGTGGSGRKIKGEFAENGFDQNILSHTRGVVSMARSQSMDSASSQFFICYDTATHLDGKYAAFGQVVEGMETVDDFLNTPRNNADKPQTPIVIKTMKVIQ